MMDDPLTISEINKNNFFVKTLSKVKLQNDRYWIYFSF